MDLRNWQERLAQHFAQLQTIRQEAGGDRPVFALEHGLNESEVQILTEAVRTHIAESAPSRDHELPWVVYAAEMGYGYSGDEYWQTFEEKTPGWILRGNRDWIRDRFRSFQRKYGGAKPSGAWAAHFTIICWPITHAILPRDLQRQLARILYELRHSFSAELFESPPKLGEFIAARSWNATSRFQNFAQETALVGQIAAALLLEGQFGTASLIHPDTLQRIGRDLDRERRAREWLSGARRFARERATIRGLAFGRDTGVAAVSRPEEARAEVAALGIEPRLLLRPKDLAGDSWEVSLEIPDLSHLLFRFPKTREILTNSRCIVAGASGRPLARGRCLYGAQAVTLSRWPHPDEVLLQFEQTDPQLEYLLRTECLLRPGPTWLFRIASDGLGYESRSLRVRPGERYIMISTGEPITESDHVSPINLECEGVRGAILQLPDALTADWEETLQRLGLGQAKTIEVWPAGLAAVVWDGEGHGEWLASERPCLAIRSDHPIVSLFVSMGRRAEFSLELGSIASGEPVYVELPQLAVGLHRVHVSARSKPAGEEEDLGDLDVVMRIREARPWSPGVSPHGPLLVQIDPVAPTLEQLWEGRTEVVLRGPAGRQVKPRVSLFGAMSNAPTFTKQLPPLDLPVTPESWRRHFEKHFQREASGAYDAAHICDVQFNAEELGSFSIRCEREFTPLRWAVRRHRQEYVAHLLDDSGDPGPMKVTRLAFETPCIEQALESASAYTVPSVGGLYVAEREAFAAAVIVPPMVRGREDLACVPTVHAQDRSIDSVLRTLKTAHIWSTARLTGDLFSAFRQRTVLDALARQIVGLIGGDSWVAAEQSTDSGPDGFTNLSRAISKRHDEIQIGTVLSGEYGRLAVAAADERIACIASLAIRVRLLPSPPPPAASAVTSKNGLQGDPFWLSQLALRVASSPGSVIAWSGQEQLRLGVKRLFEVPTLVRAARFLVLSTDRHLQSRAAPGEVYAHWGWE